MEKVMGRSEESKKKIMAYKTEWDRNNTKKLGVKLNERTDADIIEWLNQIENKAAYVKQLIRDDIVKHGGITRKPIVKETRTEISDEFTEPE